MPGAPPSPPSPLRALRLALHRPRFLALALALALAVPLLAALLFTLAATPQPPRPAPLKGTSQGGSWEALAAGADDADAPYAGDGPGGWGAGVKDWFKWQADATRSLLVTGGAGQIGQALVPALLDNYTVHVVDIVPRPRTLPSAVIYHRASPRTPGASRSRTYASLFAANAFDGVVHLAGVSLDAWCAPREAQCMEVNEGGTRELVRELEALARAAKPVPWVIMGSTMDVFGLGPGDNGEGVRDPLTALGRTKLAAEHVLEDAVDRQPAPLAHPSPGPSRIRALVLRFPEVYGFPQATSIPETFIPSLLTNALTSLPIQYASDRPPLDLLHQHDAIAGVLRAIEFIAAPTGVAAAAAAAPTVHAVNLVSGQRWSPHAVVELVRTETKSMSPVRDIGRGRHPPPAVRFGLAHAAELLGWAPAVDLTNGLGMAITQLSEDIAAYSRAYLHDHCPPTTDFQSLDTDPATAFEEDERNRPLWKLDGCLVNLAFDHAGWLHHVKCEDGVHCVADGEKVTAMNWNQTSFFVRRLDDGRKIGERSVRVRFEDEKRRGYLGLRVQDGEEAALELVDSDRDEAHTAFDLEVAHDQSYLRLVIPDTETQVHALANTTDQSTWFTVEPLTRWVEPHFDLRINTLCCPSEGDWPLLLDDFESADVRFGSTGQIPFNASRRLHLCHRAEQAVRYNFRRLSSARQTVSKVTGALESQAFADETGPRTDSRPHAWALKDLPACWNDCESPTVCVQTGECKCVQADHCQTRRASPLLRLYPASANAHRGPGGGGASPLGTLAGYHPVLSKTVEAIDWRDVLLPSARAALDAHPDFIKVHVLGGYAEEDEVEANECHKLQTTHCFSADSILYRALRHISGPKEDAELVVLPVYQQCTGGKYLLHDLVHLASETVPGVETGDKTLAVVLTHDWGICVAFAWEVWSARDPPGLYPDWILNNVLVWSVMGDYDSPCYRPHQDVVVPARTCRSVTLRETFPTVESIRPMRERKRLMTWSGTYWGTGKSERLRLTCGRGGAGEKEMVEGAGPQSNFGSWDYMNDLGDAMFCPQPRGIAGWSPRTNDAIFAGCIPVLIAEGSHYPFSTFLDWSKFSVRVAPTELDRIEQILAAIPLSKVEEMQANLVAVREAFLYSTDERPEEELERRGPMFFALHEAGMKLRTRYPVKEAE